MQARSISLKAFLSRRVVTPHGIEPAAVLVQDGRILDVVPPDQLPAQISVKDFGEAAILPGLVDSHVHINEPGRTEWEGFLTATTTVAALEAKRRAATGQCRVDWMAWGGVVSDNQEHIESLAAAGVPGFKSFLIHPGIEGFTMVTERELRAALPHVARTGLPLLVHAELPGPVHEATRRLTGADWSKYSTYLQSRPDEAELSAIQLMISLCRKYHFRLHIVHLATSQALDMLCAAKSGGALVSVETCPHYLHFSSDKIPDGQTLFKCAPPIRSRENREKLWQGLREGVIDLVATDHSPCPPEMKRLSERNFRTAWGGISSLSLALPVMWTEARGRGFTLADIARWMAEGPARLAGCESRKGRIAKDLVCRLLLEKKKTEFTATEDRLSYRHRVSPYLGERLRGVIKATYLRGNCVFADGEYLGEPGGRELRR